MVLLRKLPVSFPENESAHLNRHQTRPLAGIHRFCRWGGIAMAISLSVSACRKPTTNAPAPPPAQVTVTTAVSRDTPFYLDEIGKVTAFQVVTVTPEVAGQIRERLFKDGDELKANH